MHRNLNQVDAAYWRAAWDRKTHEPFGEGPLEKYPRGQLADGLLYDLSGVGSAGWKPTIERQQGAILRLHSSTRDSTQ